MFKGLGQLAALMKNASGLSEKMEALTRKLQTARVHGAAGGDMVRVTMNGLSQVTAVEIDPAAWASGDREMLETLLRAAINQAIERARQLHVESMREMTGGLDLPGLDSMFAKLTGDGKLSE